MSAPTGIHAPKIFGIGFPKTGTKSLRACMLHWQSRHKTIGPDTQRLYLDGPREALFDQVARFDSFDDFPWYMLYMELDQRFPGSKFILTTRKDEDAWYRSYCRFARRIGPGEDNLILRMRESIFGHAMPQDDRDAFVSAYLTHNRKVRDHFAGRPQQLLTVCWETGDGWDALARFLGKETPDLPFPHMNKAPSLMTRIKGRLRRALRPECRMG